MYSSFFLLSLYLQVRRSVETSHFSSDSAYESTFEDAYGFDDNTEYSIGKMYLMAVVDDACHRPS